MVRGRSVYRAVWIVVWLMNWAIGCTPVRCAANGAVTPEMIPAATATATGAPLLSCPTATRFRPTETATSAFPKYSPEEGYFVLSELVRTNGGCQFPCWLGITPGESSWTEVQAFFARFDSAIVVSSSHASIHVPKGFGFYDSVDIEAQFWLQDDRIVSILVESGVWYWFTEALRELGQPEEIRVQTFSQDAGPYIPFIIVLFYPSKGIAAEYGADVLKESPTTLRACLDENNIVLLLRIYHDRKDFARWSSLPRPCRRGASLSACQEIALLEKHSLAMTSVWLRLEAALWHLGQIWRPFDQKCRMWV